MKTPDEIKNGLELIGCNDIEEFLKAADKGIDYDCHEAVAKDAIAYIQQLESDNESKQKRIDELEIRLAQVERERDALRLCICGSTVYKLITTKDGSGSIVEEQLCGFHYIDPPKQRSNKRGNYMIVYHESTGHITHLPVSQIGKTIFFTYEDAKTALDERRGVCEGGTKEES